MLPLFRALHAPRAMSTTAFTFADMAVNMTSQRGREELAKLAKSHDELSKLSTVRDDAIDFEGFRKSLRTEGLVDAFEKAYKGLQLPQMADEFTADADARFSGLTAAANAQVTASKVRLAEIQDALTALRNRKNIRDVTVSEVLSEDSAMAQSIQNDIDHEIWEPEQAAAESASAKAH